MYEKQLESPFIPDKKDNFDKRYCEAIDKIGNETKARYEKHRQDDHFSSVFYNFTYIKNSQEKTARTPIQETVQTKPIFNQLTNRLNQSKPVRSFSQCGSASSANINLIRNKIKIVENKSLQNQFYNNYIQNNKRNVTPLRDNKHIRSSSLIEAPNQRGSSKSIINKSINDVTVTPAMNKGINKLPSIGTIDRLKMTKKLSGTTTSSLIKNYKQTSSTSATGVTINNSLKNFR